MIVDSFIYILNYHNRMFEIKINRKICQGAFAPPCITFFFYVLLTVHLSIIFVINQLNAQILVL